MFSYSQGRWETYLVNACQVLQWKTAENVKYNYYFSVVSRKKKPTRRLIGESKYKIISLRRKICHSHSLHFRGRFYVFNLEDVSVNHF